MRKSRRHLISWLLIALYMVVVMSPLAPAAMRSAYLAHAFTGKCSGDCNICGCSLERRAARTCCCWQKKLREQAHQPDHCKKKDQSRKIMLTCSCPCGSEKQLSPDVSGKFKLLPARNQDFLSSFYESRYLANPPLILVDRRAEPPDPPPEYIKPA
jgi:hypothetical protein